MSNIAEGSGRGTTPERNHFFHIAKWSAMELASQILLAADFGYIVVVSKSEECLWMIEEIVKILYSLTKQEKS
jgi:four helix bundle protein